MYLKTVTDNVEKLLLQLFQWRRLKQTLVPLIPRPVAAHADGALTLKVALGRLLLADIVAAKRTP